MLLSNRWHVQLGEGGRRMTDSQIKTAAERCWIDAETPVKKPQTSEWTKLGDAAPAKRIREERAAEDTADIDTSAMILLSGEFEVVDEGEAPSKSELAAARPPRLAPKMFALGLALFAGGCLLGHRYVPRFDAEVHALVAAMRPAPLPTPTTLAAPPPSPTPVVAPVMPVAPVASAASVAVVPKMPRPTPKMREPSPPRAAATPAAAAPVKKSSKSVASSAKAKQRRTPN